MWRVWSFLLMGCSLSINSPSKPNTCSQALPAIDILAAVGAGVTAAVVASGRPVCSDDDPFSSCKSEQRDSDLGTAMMTTTALGYLSSGIYGLYRMGRTECQGMDPDPPLEVATPQRPWSPDDDGDQEPAPLQPKANEQKTASDAADEVADNPVAEPTPTPTPTRPEVRLTGSGTCFAASPDGLVITAAHVTDGAEIVGVQFANEALLSASVVSKSLAMDLTVLRVERSTKEFLALSNIAPALGDKVFTIGFPSPQELGWEPKFTEGSISALSAKGEQHLLQLSVPVLAGNSGGALVSENGMVFGVVVAKLNEAKFRERTGSSGGNISFAVKSSFVAPMLESAGKVTKLSRTQAIKLVNSATCKVLTATTSR